MHKISEFLNYILDLVIPIKDALMGGLVAWLYTHIYVKKDFVSNILEFMMGVIFSIYVSPVVFICFKFLEFSFISFVCGLLGMVVMKVILGFPWKEVIFKTVTDVISALIEKLKK